MERCGDTGSVPPRTHTDAHVGFRDHPNLHYLLFWVVLHLQAELLVKALAHLPYDDAAPGVTRAGARPVAPSPMLPATAPGAIRVLGDAEAGPPDRSH